MLKTEHYRLALRDGRRSLTLTEAVEMARGAHDPTGWHHGQRLEVHVVYRHAQLSRGGSNVSAGDPVFGFGARVDGRARSMGAPGLKAAEVSWGGYGTEDPELASLQAEALRLAVTIATLANDYTCSACLELDQEREAAQAARVTARDARS